jgi:hypothetical protein
VEEKLNELTKDELNFRLRNVGETHKTDQEKRNLDQRMKEKDFFHEMTDFVKNHVHDMLVLLYSRIRQLEHQLEHLMKNPSQTDGARTEHVAVIWMKELLKTSDQVPAFRISGPVGERPIHVCALSAHRFVGVDFKGHGNYMKDGILGGIVQFISDSGQDHQNEVYAEYGKDYCALLGSYIYRELQDQANAISAGSVWKERTSLPPFFDTVQRWYDKNFSVAQPTLQMKQSVTVGLYEGETIVFPLIAAGDAKNLNWVFHFESMVKPQDEPMAGTEQR